LENADFAVDIFESEKKVPELEEVKKIINVVKGKAYGFVVGIGCGAAMDRVKIVAVMSETDDELEEYVFPRTKPLIGPKPKILRSTT